MIVEINSIRTEEEPGVTRCPRYLLALVMAVVLFSSAWVVTTPGIQTHQYADTVLFPLISTQAWTPYCWDQDRLGTLVPLLSMPIKNLFLNLLFQQGLSLCALFCCFWGIAFCFVNARLSMIIGLASVFILTAFFPAGMLFEFITHPEYNVSLILGLTGIHSLFRRQRKSGVLRFFSGVTTTLICFALSTWVNITIPIIILPLILSTGIWMIFSQPREEQQCEDRRQLSVRALRMTLLGSVLLIAAALSNYLLMKKLDLPSTPTDILPASMWFAAWRSAALLLGQNHVFVYVAVLLTALTVGSTYYGHRRQHLPVKMLLPTALLLLTALAYLMISALSIHVFHSHHYRYFIPAVILLIAGGLTGSFLMLQGMRSPTPIALTLTVAIFCCCFFRYGIPSIGKSEHALDKRWGAMARAIIRHDCTHVMGDFWRVWPAVFWTNHLLEKANASHQVYGITYRCAPSANAWNGMPAERFRIAGIHPITKAYTDWGTPLPALPELRRTEIIFEPDMHLYQSPLKATTHLE